MDKNTVNWGRIDALRVQTIILLRLIELAVLKLLERF